MRRLLPALLVLAASALTVTAPASALTVDVRSHPVDGDVQLRFSAPKLPNGGYYYGVIVLRHYRGFTGALPPECSTSSDMQHTAYGYPPPDGELALALAPTPSDTGRWCRGGRYEGAIYAVPQAPPCESTYPCSSEPYEPSPCWGSEGHVVCGVVALRSWRYPDPLPPPRASGTRIVGRFSVSFPSRVLHVQHLSARVYDVNETLEGVVSSHESLRAAGRRVGQDFSTCVPIQEEISAHCTGKYVLPGGTIRFAGTVGVQRLKQTLTILGGTGRYRDAEGTILTEYAKHAHRASETITLEG